MRAVRGVRIGLRILVAGTTFAVDGGTAAELLKAGSATLLHPARDLARLGRAATAAEPLPDDAPMARLVTR